MLKATPLRRPPPALHPGRGSAGADAGLAGLADAGRPEQEHVLALQDETRYSQRTPRRACVSSVTSQHILNASASLLGFCLIVTALRTL